MDTTKSVELIKAEVRNLVENIAKFKGKYEEAQAANDENGINAYGGAVEFLVEKHVEALTDLVEAIARDAADTSWDSVSAL